MGLFLAETHFAHRRIDDGRDERRGRGGKRNAVWGESTVQGVCELLEANYAHQQELDMIPLMMQKDYQPQGWRKSRHHVLHLITMPSPCR